MLPSPPPLPPSSSSPSFSSSRTGLGVTCCLAVVTIGFVGDVKPKVPYGTALDVYIICCFVIVFLSLAEFAFTNFVEL